jgi:hypothetical protein
MKAALIAAAIGLSLALAPSHAAARNYDCTKAANANRAVCKSAAKAAGAAAHNPAPSATKISSTTVTRTKTERTYDCTKRGNANKAQCKTAATPSKPVVKQTTVSTTTRHYDCAKAGNANKQQCKASASVQQASTKPVSMPKAAAQAKASVDANPAGAIARCKDGTYSHAKTHRGACSRHGGVANWLG